MVSVVPTITAEAAEAYSLQLGEVRDFAPRVHIDLMDGKFAPTSSVGLDHVWWPGNIRADLHVMYANPFAHTDVLVSLGPQLIIVHAEAAGDFAAFADQLHHHGIETGVALLPETPVSRIAPALDLIDHVLVFSGNLGHQGGSRVDFALLDKVKQLRQLKPTLEIGWDGGVDADNAGRLARAGVEVLNVGGFMRTGSSPHAQYNALKRAVER